MPERFIMVCVNNTGVMSELTEGKDYLVEKVDDRYKCINDLGHLTIFYPYRFKPLEDTVGIIVLTEEEKALIPQIDTLLGKALATQMKNLMDDCKYKEIIELAELADQFKNLLYKLQ